MLVLITYLFGSCSPNEEIVECRDNLLDLSDNIRFTRWQNPFLNDIFEIDGQNIDDILETISIRLEEKMTCDCKGPCTIFEDLQNCLEF